MSEQDSSEVIQLAESDLQGLEQEIEDLIDEEELLDACLDLNDHSEVRDESLIA
jgi:hypothetical protein